MSKYRFETFTMILFSLDYTCAGASWFGAASQFPADNKEAGREGCRRFISACSCSFRVDTCRNTVGDKECIPLLGLKWAEAVDTLHSQQAMESVES